jgi:hypothetical protein
MPRYSKLRGNNPMATKEQQPAAVATPAAKPMKYPQLKPQHVMLDPGQYFRRALIKLPKPMPGELEINPIDIFEQPNLWTAIQASRNSPLMKLDDVRIVGADEGWFIDTTIVEADDKVVKFKKAPVTELPAPFQSWQDEHVTIVYEGAQKFVTRNKATNAVVASGHTSIDAAKSEYLKNQPKRVA